MGRLRAALLVVVGVLVLCLWGAGPAAAQTTHVVQAVDPNSWSPANISAQTGDTVRWEFDGTAVSHNVRSSSANWTLTSPIQVAGPPVQFTFDTPGTYTFLCEVHGSMTGSVTVADAPADPLEKILVFSETAGFRHDSIPQGIAALQALGTANDFTVDATEDSTAFNDANLAQYDVVVFLSTTGDVLTDEQQAAFERYIQAGNGYVGIHAAADTEYTWPWYGEMLGGYFRNHPPGTPSATVRIEDGDEPSTQGLPTTWPRVDEWYNYQSPVDPVVGGGGPDYSPRNSGVKVLATVDESTYVEEDGNATDDDHPISWCSDFDGGHVWYTGMGHTQGSFSEPDFRTHLLGGLQTAAGMGNADCGAPREASPSANDFEIVTIDDDTESPMELDVANDGRVFYIERITGEVNVWNPVNGAVTTAVQIPVDSNLENGGLGIQLAPDFDTSGHIYVAYTPPASVSATTQRVSRFTVVNNTISLASEQIIFTWDLQRQTCCHSSGSLAFDAAGNLYIATGDNTNPFESDGFAPIDERPGRQNFDAQRTSANTNNLNGKILRITPIAGATGVPGEGTTYTVPTGNMFPEAQDTTDDTRPEIFAMGFRNPFRITVDPKTGWILMGDYGPDAGATNPNRGPQGSVEFNVITGPGNYGWPYCVRDNVPYNDYDFATGVSGPTFNCAAPVNNSPNNTGLTNLPPARPATMWIGYTETDARFPGLGTGGAPTGGPRYDFDPLLDSDTKFPEFYDGHWFIGEWNNGWIKTATLDAAGNATGVFDSPWMDTFFRPHEIEFGPDGALYVIDWGSGFGGNNINSGIFRIDYVKGARRPIATATATPDSGPVPLPVQFSSEGSIDPDGTSITYAWDFDGNGTTDSTEANPTHTYQTAGTFNALLTVTDQSGSVGTDTVQVIAGNTRPTVQIVIPEDGQFANFGDIVPYEILVTDPEDGTIDCSQVTLNIQLGHDDHAHSLASQPGCSGTFETATDGGHGATANIFTSLVATYTDEGNGNAAPITGRDEAILHTKRKRAQYFDSTGRAPGGATGGTPGVQTEATADEGGGNNIGFIEHGDYISFERVNLEETTGIRFRVASAGSGGTIQLRLDAPDGQLVGETAFINPTGGWQTWANVDLALPNPPEGTHEVFIVFNNPAAGDNSLMNLNWFQVSGRGAAVSASPDVGASAEPSTGTAPLQVQFTGTATDPDAAAGEQLTYRWDFGVPGTTDDTSTEQNPTYTYQNAGTYIARFTATDPFGARATASVEVRVTPAGACPQGVRSDEFNGSALDTGKWTVIRPDDTHPFEVANGELRLPIDNGSIYGAGTSARNIIVQPLGDGDVEVTAKLRVEPLTDNYQQAGLRVYAGDDDWASVHMIYAGGTRDIEFIYENDNTPRNEAADKIGGLPAGAPLEYWVRIVKTGTTLTAFYSFDGVTFLPVGRPADISTWVNPQIGPTALSDAAPTFPDAYFDWIRFVPDGTTGGGGGGGGTTVVDEFNGTQLASPPWTVVRQDQNLTVSGGTLNIPAAPGDLYGGSDTADNLVLRDAPDGAWTATAKLNFEGLVNYQQAGILVYGDDANYTKLGRIAHTAAGDEKFEFIYENAGTPRNDAADSTANIPADFPDDFWVRITSDGTNLTGAYSTNGTSWTPVGRPAPLPANAQIGMFAFSGDATGNPVAAFDSFTLTSGTGGPAGPSFDDQFDGSTLDKERWNAIVRENANAYSVAGGQLTITTEPGDIYTGDTTPPPNNFILQDAAHAGTDWVIETKLSGTINGGYAQGGLIAYVDGNNYVKLDPISDAGSTRINRIELRSEVNGTPVGPVGQPDPEVPAGTTDIWVRLTKTGTSYAGEYSFNGQTWVPMGSVTNAMASPDFGVYAFGPQPDGQGDTVSFDYFTLDGQDLPSECECVPGPGDEFDAAALDKTKWNSIVREDAAQYVLQDGALRITTVAGDIYAGGDATPTRNFILQTAPAGDWVIETKVSGDLQGGYEQGGLLVYVDDQNYIKYDLISDDGQTIKNRIELRSEVNGTIQDPQPQVTTPAPGYDAVWLRLTKTGTSYAGEYSLDGVTWTSIGQPVSNPMAEPRIGLFTLGVNSPGGTAVFDYFAVNGNRGCEEGEPPNAPPLVGEPTASPTIGTGPLQVNFTASATDADGDPLTYSWDFQDDGTEDSTEQNPTFTYTTPGVKTARVTVSDGEDTRSRTVEVQVLEPDQAGARFRVLVFSKTAGFRHSSIDEGHAAIEQLGAENNFQVDHTEDATAFRDAILANYDAVVWLSTTGDVLNDTQQAAFQRYIRAGNGYAGIHAAADTEYDWKWYGRLVGAYFLSHPAGTYPNGGRDGTVVVEDPTDRSMQGVPTPRWDRIDEWYNYKPVNFEQTGNVDYSPRADVHVLASLDESTYEEADGSDGVNDDHPIAWCQLYDGGRSWYTGMGHTDDSYTEVNFLRHLLGGIEDAAGAAGSDICNLSPTVEATADPKTGTAPLAVAFSANGSDREGQALTYAWNFGDGGTSFLQNPSHTYTTAGTYTATVTVSDGRGGSDTDTVAVTVGNRTPSVVLSATPTSGKAPLTVAFTASGSDPDGDPLTYRYDFGDGTKPATGASVSHRYTKPGTFIAKVTVTDSGGATSTAQIEIRVTRK